MNINNCGPARRQVTCNIRDLCPEPPEKRRAWHKRFLRRQDGFSPLSHLPSLWLSEHDHFSSPSLWGAVCACFQYMVRMHFVNENQNRKRKWTTNYIRLTVFHKGQPGQSAVHSGPPSHGQLRNTSEEIRSPAPRPVTRCPQQIVFLIVWLLS